MIKIIIIICMVLYGFNYFSEQYRRDQLARKEAGFSKPTLRVNDTLYDSPAPTRAASPEPAEAESHPTEFKCDGRVYCSAMHSCEEATFFINNCPGTKMDGDHDGIPCESQWC